VGIGLLKSGRVAWRNVLDKGLVMGIRVLFPLLLGWVAILLTACETGEQRHAASMATPGVSDAEVRIGSSLALTGHASFLGIQTLRGAQCYLNHVNDTGGIHGRRIKLIALDDGYDPTICVANTQQLLVDENVFALFCYVGTPTTVKIIPLVERAKVPLIGMFTGANALREPFNPYIINVRASYYQETGVVVKHLVEDMGLKKIAVFYQYDAYGLDGLRGAELGLKKYNLAPVAKSSYTRGTLDVEEGLEKVLESDAQAVIMIGTYEPCAKFIRLAKNRRSHLIFYNVSFVGVEELARLLGQDGEDVIVSQVVPPPELPEARDMLKDVDRYVERLRQYFPDEKPNSVSLEGYFNALVLGEGLKRAGQDLTREGFIKAIESIRDYPLGKDAILSFGDQDHQGMDRVYFTIIKSGKLVLLTDWKDLSRRYGHAPPATP